jgi:hypothetical protein
MKIPLNIAKQLSQLCQGERIPGSMMKSSIFRDMIENGVLVKHVIGRSKSIIYAKDRNPLEAYLKNHFGINDLNKYILALTDESISRAKAIIASSDSKIKSIRSFRGFPVKSLCPVKCTLNKKSFVINPLKGAFTYITDYKNFIPDPEVTVVGIENAENFLQLEKQKYLFCHLQAVFVCRYPQSKDLIKWLITIPNKYLHYGDLDIAGLNIYMNEFKKHLLDRAVFFLPPDPESLFINFGNRDLYQKQSVCFDINKSEEQNVRFLISLINKYRKGVEQEILIQS